MSEPSTKFPYRTFLHVAYRHGMMVLTTSGTIGHRSTYSIPGLASRVSQEHHLELTQLRLEEALDYLYRSIPVALWGPSEFGITTHLKDILNKLPTKEPTVTTNTNYKQDNGKLDYTLLMNDLQPQVEAIVKVLHWGHHTKGYPRQGYKTLPGGTDRLTAACYRHLAAMSEDFWAKDEESGQPHVVHAVANLLMAMAKTPEGKA